MVHLAHLSNGCPLFKLCMGFLLVSTHRPKTWVDWIGDSKMPQQTKVSKGTICVPCTLYAAAPLVASCVCGYMHTCTCVTVPIHFSFCFSCGHVLLLVFAFVCGLPGGSEKVQVAEEWWMRSRRRAERQHRVIVETFGKRSHQRTQASFCSPVFKGKKRKMTSSPSCEAEETEGGRGEGGLRTLSEREPAHTKPSSDLFWPCVCQPVHMCISAVA